MDRECRRRRAGPMNIQKRYLFSRSRKDAAAVLAARSADQTGIGQFRKRFPDESRVYIHAFSDNCRRDFLAATKNEERHDMRCNGELNALGSLA